MLKCERCGHEEETSRGRWCSSCELKDGLKEVGPRGYVLIHGNPKPLAEESLGRLRERSDSSYDEDGKTRMQWDVQALLQHIDALQARLDELEGKAVDWMGEGETG